MKSFRLSLSVPAKSLVLLCGLSVAGFGGTGVTPLAAQSSQSAKQRVIQGKVEDSKSGAPLKGAVVYLKDDGSMAVKSYISDDSGGYRFGQLMQNTDYDLWAESNGKKSSTKHISSFDNKNTFTITLKIDTAK